MTTFYRERQGIVSFETDPSANITADAKYWSPVTEDWVACPGSTGIGAEVRWSGDFMPISQADVPAAMAQIRASWTDPDGDPPLPPAPAPAP